MTEDNRIPKHRVEAEVTIAGHEAQVVHLYLGERARQHSGPERPSDLLNGDKTFLPAIGAGDQLAFIRREAILLVTVDAEHEDVENPDTATAAPDAVSKQVEARLENGVHIRGTVTYVLPRNRRRLQDFLNEAPTFIPLLRDDTIRFVNKQRIAWMVPI